MQGISKDQLEPFKTQGRLQRVFDVDRRQALAGTASQAGAEIVLSGHDHDYQRSVPINGVTYVVSGGGCKTTPVRPRRFTATATLPRSARASS